MEVKAGYRQTELGWIPNDWKETPITSLIVKGSTLTYGVVQPGPNDPNGVLFVRGGDILGGRINESYLRRISQSVSRQYERTRLNGGELVISLVGYPGEVAVVPNTLTGANIARQVALVRLENETTPFRNYVCHYFQSDLGRRQLLKEAIGSAQQVINLKDIKKAIIIIPPSETEWSSVAGALTDADAWIESLERLIAKKRDLKQGAMQELLTGRRRLPGFKGEWATKQLGELFAFSGGHSASRDQLSSEGHCYLHYGDIHTSNKYFIDLAFEQQDIPKLDISLRKVSPDSQLSDGDIVFVDASEDLDGSSKHVVVVNPGGIPYISGLHTIVAKSKTQELHHLYRRYCFQTAAIQSQFRFYAVGTKVSGISKANIKKLWLPVPDRDEQAAIAAILNDMDAEISALESNLAKARQLKQGMMQQLLTGRIRLI